MSKEYKRIMKNVESWSQLHQNKEFLEELKFRIKAVSHANAEAKKLFKKHKNFECGLATLNKQEFLSLIKEIELCDEILPKAFETLRKALAKLDLIYIKLHEDLDGYEEEEVFYRKFTKEEDLDDE